MVAYASLPPPLDADDGRGPIDLIDRIDAGLPVAMLYEVAEMVARDPAALVRAVVPKATLTRRKREGRLSPAEGAVVARLAEVWGQAAEVWGDPEAARDFLARPHAMLADRRPLDLVVQSEIGAEMVRQILGRLAFGSAA